MSPDRCVRKTMIIGSMKRTEVGKLAESSDCERQGCPRVSG